MNLNGVKGLLSTNSISLGLICGSKDCILPDMSKSIAMVADGYKIVPAPSSLTHTLPGTRITPY